MKRLPEITCVFLALALAWPGGARGQNLHLERGSGCRAVRFNGKDRIRIPHSQSLDLKGPVTIEAWVHGSGREPWSKYPNLIGKRRSGIRYPTWALGIWNDGCLYTVADESQQGLGRWRKSRGKVPVGRWSHVAVVFNGEQIRFFIDGHPQPAIHSLGLGPSNTDDVYIGGTGENTHGLQGYLTSIRVSTSIRYTETFQPELNWEPDEKTVLLLTFDEADGPDVFDSSGRGNHGKLLSAERTRHRTCPVSASSDGNKPE